GIRVFHVTGVQTCALPISEDLAWLGARREAASKGGEARSRGVRNESGCFVAEPTQHPAKRHPTSSQATTQTPPNIQPSDSDPAQNGRASGRETEQVQMEIE